MEQIRIKSNTGRIVIDKTINDLGLKSGRYSNSFDTAVESNSRYVIDKHGNIVERKKKCRLYSLGGDEPKKSHLVRMKTVGTFDLCMEVTALACGFNQQVMTIPKPAESNLESVVSEISELEEEKLEAIVVSPKRHRHISTSDNSFSLDGSSIISNKKRFRSLSSNSHLQQKSSNEFRCKSATNIYAPFALKPKVEESEEEQPREDKFVESYQSMPLSVRRRTFKKSRKIVRTDSELFHDQILSAPVEESPINNFSSEQTSFESDRFKSKENLSSDTVFSSEVHEENIDLEELENEYKEHVKSSLQREYKSDGDSLDEIGKDRYGLEWKNQSVDFEFLENDKVEEMRVKAGSVKGHAKKIRNDLESRSKSEGDKDTLYSKADSTETQSTEDENKIEVDPQHATTKVEKHQSLFEKRFGKLKKMNKLLKVKRFSTSALYDKRKASDAKTKEPPPVVLAALQQVSDFTTSKTSLASPKSLKGKRFHLKKRKFSFFGKSQSNNDLNINLKSLASKLSLISKSNFDLSKNSSNLRLNTVGIYGKYGTSNEYRSDIITKQCTSPLSEAFYNATGSCQLTPMELFEKFCSQDFSGLYKHESITEFDEPLLDSFPSKGAIKKQSSCLRKTTLLKQNSEPKFCMKTNFTKPQEVFEEEEIESVENESEEYEFNSGHTAMRRSSYGRQLEFDTNDHYYVDPSDQYYLSDNPDMYGNGDEDIDEIYLMPGKQRYDGGYLRNSEEILAIDETDEEILEDSLSNVVPETDSEFDEKENLLPFDASCLRDEDISDIEIIDDGDKSLKTIITEYVKNSCIPRSQSLDLLSNSSETLKSNSEYAFDTVKQLHLDSCSTSKLSLSLNSDIFDDITIAAPLDENKPVKICEMDDFTLTPDGSMSENNKVKAAQESEQDKIKSELQSQYTIIDCDELEHDGESVQRFNDDKSSFAEALNKEFDKLFSRVVNDSDTDLTTTPSAATVLTAIKMPSRTSMDKLEALPYEFDQDNIIGGISEEKTLHKSLSTQREETSTKIKSKRSQSLGVITKKKSNKCTPL